MKEKTLVYLCLVIAIIGIIIMFLSNKIFQPKLIMISDLSGEHNFVKIQGKVEGVVISKSGTTFIKLSDSTGVIDVVVFKDSIVLSDLTKGMEVEVIGKPDFYKDKLEVIATDIQMLNSERV